MDGTISLRQAAVYMGVSYRHAKRLKGKAEDGLAGLAHANRGRRPWNRVDVCLDHPAGKWGEYARAEKAQA